MLIRKFMLVVIAVTISATVVLRTNPYGFGQRIFWGMLPPYHWVSGDTVVTGSLHEEYVGTNGVTCATVYRYVSQNTTFTVYGFGFHRSDLATRKEAERIAMRECR